VISFTVSAETRNGVTAEYTFPDFAQPREETENGIRVQVGNELPYKVTLTPPAGDHLARIRYTASTNLRNFHEVIIPDTGRSYSGQTQLVNFWAKRFPSRLNNVRMPLFILTGTDLRTEYVFGVLGDNVETDFVVLEPGAERALVAWMKRFTLAIERGTEDFPLPDSVAAANGDGSITEYICFQEGFDPPRPTWIETLRAFSTQLADVQGKRPRTVPDSLLPFWCSWTDWFSGDVSDKIIAENVEAGMKLGIKNYIVDDGWFGPGLDSDLTTKLNIGDWYEDPGKIPDLRALVEQIHRMDGNAIIWCAPHAVAPDAKCFPDRRHLLIKLAGGEYLMTHNKFHSLCFRCPQARELMAEICADLVRRYDVDGAKYDLFNCVPDLPCVSDEHEHDTSSMIEGLGRTLELIEAKTRALKDDYIVELKQNYATPYWFEYGTVVRAGDTPYNSEGNFLRTAYINAYTPYSLNDYQTITNNDSPETAAVIILKMLAVGVPSYSINLPALKAEHKEILARLNRWYADNLPGIATQRVPLDGKLGCWVAKTDQRDIYFLLNEEDRVPVRRIRDLQVACGTHRPRARLVLPEPASGQVSVDSTLGGNQQPVQFAKTDAVEVDVLSGDILTVRFE